MPLSDKVFDYDQINTTEQTVNNQIRQTAVLTEEELLHLGMLAQPGNPERLAMNVLHSPQAYALVGNAIITAVMLELAERKNRGDSMRLAPKEAEARYAHQSNDPQFHAVKKTKETSVVR